MSPVKAAAGGQDLEVSRYRHHPSPTPNAYPVQGEVSSESSGWTRLRPFGGWMGKEDITKERLPPSRSQDSSLPAFLSSCNCNVTSVVLGLSTDRLQFGMKLLT